MDNACRGCRTCNGHGCVGEIPGMGAEGRSLTFINNYNSWNELDIDISGVELPLLGVAPMTGVGQNMGNVFPEEKFHSYIAQGAKKSGVLHCIGDGTPDFKLQSGIDSMVKSRETGVAFIKPYANNIIIERFKMVEDITYAYGVDIDSYRIPTMTGLVSLEKKSAHQLNELKAACKKKFILKGIQSLDDLNLIKEVQPDIVVVSNHGGRVFDNGEGIAHRLNALMPELSKYTEEVWVDGGIRTKEHMRKAKALGAKRVLIGRPFIQATAVFKEDGIPYWLKELK